MEQFDLEKDLKKYVREARLVMPGFALSVLLTLGFFAVLMICLLTDSTFKNYALILMSICAGAAIVFGVFYYKHRLQYDVFCYLDMYPDMGEPLNLLLIFWYKQRLEQKMMETYNLTLVSGGFARVRQIFVLQLTVQNAAKQLFSAEFYIDKANLHNLDSGESKILSYEEILDKNDDDQTKLKKCLAVFIPVNVQEGPKNLND